MTVCTIMSAVSLSAVPIPTKSGSRPHRSPTRNADGEFLCTHDECSDIQPKFKRLCEFNKHMDKHERPYKCSNPACRKSPGFTYAGGLLRHQREVHNMHRTKEPFFCPHMSCNRSSGSGFSRRENLEEHLRRRHSGISVNLDDTATDSITTSPLSATIQAHIPSYRPLEPLPASRKRRADSEAEFDYDADHDSHLGEAKLRERIELLQQENSRLRSELYQMAQENKRLRGMLASTLPPLPLQAQAQQQIQPQTSTVYHHQHHPAVG